VRLTLRKLEHIIRGGGIGKKAMYCTRCGARSSEGDAFCQQCGSPLNRTLAQMPFPSMKSPSASSSTPRSPVGVYVQGTQGVRRTSGLAVAALILGILGIWILAIIFGVVAMGQTRRNPRLSGRGLAVAGFVLGLAWALIGVFLVVLRFIVPLYR
jgi:hypothetical protein